MITYWAAHAHLPNGPASRVRLTVDGERFREVSVGVDPAPADERLAGVVLPGLANAHSHAFHRALRGRTHSDGGSFWTWREQMYAFASRLDPDHYLALARALYSEMALAGTTAVGEFHYLHHRPGGRPYADPNAMGLALIQAAADAGVRLTLLDTCYLAADWRQEGIPGSTASSNATATAPWTPGPSESPCFASHPGSGSGPPRIRCGP